MIIIILTSTREKWIQSLRKLGKINNFKRQKNVGKGTAKPVSHRFHGVK